MPKNYTVISACRICGNKNIESIYSLGDVPLANSLVKKEDENKEDDRFPLTLVFCPRCSLIQIKETVDPETLFKNYLYFSSFSDMVLHRSKEFAENLIRERHLNQDSLVVEVASNDGYLLSFFKRKKIPILGIEPAENIAKIANEKGITTLCDFFNLKCAEKLVNEGKRADVIIGNNVLAHISDLNGFVEGIHVLLKEKGIGSFEFPYIVNMIRNTEFDTIYHEHLCYFSLTAVMELFKRHQLMIINAELTEIHGGSLRITLTHQDSGVKVSDSIHSLLKKESEEGLSKIQFYRNFTSKIDSIHQHLTSLLNDLKSKGNTIAAYGAAAKGSMLLTIFKLGKETIDFIVDRSTYKQNLFMPGNHIPIFGPEYLLQKQPDYLLILAWNFADEIMDQQQEYQRKGGKFIVPNPTVSII